MANEVKTVLTADVSGFTSDMIKAEQTTTNFGNSMTKAGSKSNTLKAALRNATKEAMNLQHQLSQMTDVELKSDLGQQLQEQFQQAIQEAGRFKDQMNDVNQTITNLASDTAGWDAAKEGIGVLSSSMQSLAGIVGVCGGDVTAFTQALAVMNTVQSVANTVIGIGNALQKQSALMTGLRAIKTALLGKSLTAATTAQLANNAATLANPYVAAAAAVVALGAALTAWIISMDDATTAELSMKAALDAFNEAVDNEAKKTGDQISAFMKLKQTYDECGGKVDEIKKKIIDNTDAQKDAGVTVNNLDKATRLFSSEGTKAFVAGTMARMNALAAEAAIQIIYTEVLGEVSKALMAIAAGEEVNIADVEKLAAKLGVAKDKFKEFAFAAGYAEQHVGPFARNNLILKDGVNGIEAQMKLVTSLFDFSGDSGTIAQLRKVEQEWLNTSDAIYEAGNVIDTVGFKSDKAGKKSSKSAKDAKTEWEKLQDAIKKVEKEIQSLDKSTGGYQTKLNKLKTTLGNLKLRQIDFLDKSSLDGLVEARNILQEVQGIYPENSDELETVNNLLNTTDDALINIFNKLKDKANEKELKAIDTILSNIISTIPVGTDAWREYIGILRDVRNRTDEIKRATEDALREPEKGTVSWLRQEISKKDEDIEKTKDRQTIEKLRAERDQLEHQLANLLNDWAYEYNTNIKIDFIVTPQFDENGEMLPEPKVEKVPMVKIDPYAYRGLDDFNKYALQEAEKYIDEISGRVKWLQEQVAHPEKTPDWGLDMVKEELAVLTPALDKMRKEFKIDTIYNDILDYEKKIKDTQNEIMSAQYDSVKAGADVLHSFYDAVADLPNRLDECDNAAEGFFAILDAGFSIVDSIISFIENIKKITELMKQLTTATNQSKAATDAKAAADAAATGKAFGKAGANAAVAGTEAGSQMASTGPWGWVAGIAAALAIVGALFGIISSAKGYATGGIVQGSTTVGDQVYTRLNAGEMVLNRGQQARLFKLIDSGVIGTNNNELTGTVRVKGSDLYMSLNNYNKITGKKV